MSKYLTSRKLTSITPLVAPVLIAFATTVFAQESTPKFVGMNSCSSSSCHGGAAENRDQCVIWSKRDFHSRAFATLTTARSERLGDVLEISPTADANCTSCHAPFETVPASLQAKKLDVTLGVSCESCHGAAENWLLSHTRADFTHVDRVNSGMRDLKNLYVRANTCVACHQNVSSNLLAAGHPELIFELDGQGVSEPKHWRESANWSGAQTWLVGQTVALREISWQLSKTPHDSKLRDQFLGLFWVLEKLPEEFRVSEAKGDFAAATEIQRQSDELARRISEMKWRPDLTRKILSALAGTAGDFKTKDVSQTVQGRRAERLVLGLDRLVQASQKKVKTNSDAELNQLLSLVQSLPDFDSSKFAAELEKFSRTISTNSD